MDRKRERTCLVQVRKVNKTKMWVREEGRGKKTGKVIKSNRLKKKDTDGK